PPQMLPASSLQPGTAIVGSGSAVPVAQPPSMPLPVQAHLPGVPSQAQPAIPAVGAPAALMNVGQPGSAAPVAQRPSVTNQMAPSVLGPSAAVPAPSQGAPPVPAGAVYPGSQSVPSGLPQSLGIPPPGNLMPMQATDPLVQGMAQLPPVSPIPPASAVPGHSASNVPPAPVSLASSKTLAQPSGLQNGSLVQNASQPALLPTGMNLPGAASSSQFSAQSLAQSIAASRTEEAKRPTEAFPVGLAQPPGGAKQQQQQPLHLLGLGRWEHGLFPLPPEGTSTGRSGWRGRQGRDQLSNDCLGSLQGRGGWVVVEGGISANIAQWPFWGASKSGWCPGGSSCEKGLQTLKFRGEDDVFFVRKVLKKCIAWVARWSKSIPYLGSSMRGEMWGMKLKLSCVDLKSHPKETQGRNVVPGGYFHPW
ncbi:hypothetical protein E2320_004933, partial [Naja naja]